MSLSPEQIQEIHETNVKWNKWAIHGDTRTCHHCGKSLDPGESCGCPEAEAIRQQRLELRRRK